MDNYIVSARKYRPATFDSVVGQQTLTQTLKNAIHTHKLAHAYLFCGPRGVGKTTCARIFAKTINCLTPTSEGEACNNCESCVAFNEQRSYNIHELDAASNNSVDGIRELIAQVQIPPQIGHYKVYIIDEVHMLSTQAFNAFLKTLEEPPHHAVFILATTEKHKILATILSRCQTYDFNRITQQDTIDHLAYVAQKENVQFEKRALSIIAQKADGGMRDALSIFDQLVSSTRGNLSYEEVIANLNVLDYDYFFRMTQACLEGKVSEALLLLDQTIRKGFDPHHFITGFAAHLRDILVCKDPITIPLLEVEAELGKRYHEQAQQAPLAFLYKALEESNSCDLQYKMSKNKRLLVELCIIRIAQIVAAPAASQQATPIQPMQPAAPQPTAQTSSPRQGITPPTPAQTATPQTAQAPQSPQQATATPVAQASVSTASTPPAEPARPRATGLKAGLKKISIKHGIQKEDTAVAQPTALQAMHQPVDAPSLENAWKEYMKGIEKQPILYNTIRSSKPTLLNEKEFEVIVDNPDQVTRLHEKGAEILYFLRNKLQNSELSMRIRESEKNERVRVFSDREKFSFMVHINPDVMKLRDAFGLDLA